MAKVKSMGLRNYVGRLGGSVYYMLKGQNIGRELAPAVSNPRTTSQQEQRLRLANMVAFYRSNQPWMKAGAFESKKQTWSDYNAFVSANAGVSPVYLTKAQAAAGGCVVAPYVVTKGSLPSVALISDDGNQEFVSDLYVGELNDISGTTTAAVLSRALRDNNNGLQEGDQLSFILNIQGTTAEGTPVVTARYYEFIIDSEDNRTLADLGLEGVIGNDIWDDLRRLVIYTDGQTCGAALIVSRTTSGAIKVSNEAMTLNAAATAYLANFTSDAAFSRAALSYGESYANFLDSGYSGKASNVAVPISQSLLNIVVGDVEVTKAARDIGNNTNFGDTTPFGVTAKFAQPVTAVTDAYFETTDKNQSITLMPATISGNSVKFNSDEFNTALGHVTISRFVVVADGQTYSL